MGRRVQQINPFQDATNSGAIYTPELTVGFRLKLDFNLAPPPALFCFPHSLIPETYSTMKPQAFITLSQILPLESPT